MTHNVNQQIESILDRRLGTGAYVGNGRLQKIEKTIDNVKKVKEGVINLNSLVTQIDNELTSQTGPYFAMLQADPEAMMEFKGISCEKAEKKLDVLLEALYKLRNRFDRKALRIAFIGRERQGKSTFIKTITGLNDKVIPAYSGNSCTGAVSVIHNYTEAIHDQFGKPAKVKVEVEYYDTQEFLSIVNTKLKTFFPDKNLYVGRLEQIRDLQLPDQLTGNVSNKVIAEYIKFKDSVIAHYKDYADLIGTGCHTYYNEDEIALHVAQYEEFDSSVSGSYPVTKNDGSIIHQIDYYKYVAVKKVDIFTKFQIEATNKLELVDTIGIGSSSDSEAIEKEMFRVLREDCDGAIDLFRPDVTPNYPDEQIELLDKIALNLKDRTPQQWIVYVFNKISGGLYRNTESAVTVLKNAEKILNSRSIRPVAWAKAIDGANFENVKDELVSPLLNLIAENLENLDAKMIATAEVLAADAYSECLSLVRAANSVISGKSKFNASAISLFDNTLYPKLLWDFGKALNTIDQLGYGKQRDNDCEPLVDAYNTIIKTLDVVLPEEEDLFQRLLGGAFTAAPVLFGDVVEQMRNDIFTLFEGVNTKVLRPEQEKVKEELCKILFNEGKFGKLPVSYSKPSKEWLIEVMDTYVDENTYPNLHKALKFILDYQINIEGMIEYNVTRGLYIIDATHKDFIPYDAPFTADFGEMASNVWQEASNRIQPIQRNMRTWIKDFTKIPSHSFYSRVHKFHSKMLSDKEGLNDLHNFYRDNMGLIWNEEIGQISVTQKAFGDWTARTGELQKSVISENFKLN